MCFGGLRSERVVLVGGVRGDGRGRDYCWVGCVGVMDFGWLEGCGVACGGFGGACDDVLTLLMLSFFIE